MGTSALGVLGLDAIPAAGWWFAGLLSAAFVLPGCSPKDSTEAPPSVAKPRVALVMKSLANEFFNIDRKIGLWAEGEPCRIFYYNVAVTNGIDTVNQAPGGGSKSDTRMDQTPAFVGKLDFTRAGDHKGSYDQTDLKGLDKPLFVVDASGLYQKYNGTQEDGTFIDTQRTRSPLRRNPDVFP